MIEAIFADLSVAEFAERIRASAGHMPELPFVAEEVGELVPRMMLNRVAVERSLVRGGHVQGQARAVARFVLSPRAASARGASGASPWTRLRRTAPPGRYASTIKGGLVVCLPFSRSAPVA